MGVVVDGLSHHYLVVIFLHLVAPVLFLHHFGLLRGEFFVLLVVFDIIGVEYLIDHVVNRVQDGIPVHLQVLKQMVVVALRAEYVVVHSLHLL